MKRKTGKASRARRDQDYRAREAPVDWAHLVYKARRNVPGAREVLQDAILEWFPRQFEEAKRDAFRLKSKNNIYDRGHGAEFFIGFDANVARRRFSQRLRFSPLNRKINSDLRQLASKKHLRNRLNVDESPFQIYFTRKSVSYTSRPRARAAQLLKSSSPPTNTTLIWSTKGKKGTSAPRLHGALRRKKIPILYWFYTEEDEGNDDGEGVSRMAIFAVRGEGSSAWAKEKFEIFGERWDRVDTSDYEGALASVYDPPNDPISIQDIRKNGYTNKVVFLQYDPGRDFFLRRR